MLSTYLRAPTIPYLKKKADAQARIKTCQKIVSATFMPSSIFIRYHAILGKRTDYLLKDYLAIPANSLLPLAIGVPKPSQRYLNFWNPEKDSSRKGAKQAKFGENNKILVFAPLASWRENLCWSRSVQHFMRKNLKLAATLNCWGFLL